MDSKGGGILGICIIIAAAIVVFAPHVVPRVAPPASEVGRYQFARSNGVNVFVLDTKTGRVWQRHVDPSGGPTDWSENKTPWVEAKEK
jgi:hypothetical protein